VARIRIGRRGAPITAIVVTDEVVRIKMNKNAGKNSQLFEDLKEGIDAAIKFAQGRRVRGMSVTKVAVTPVRKRTPAQVKVLRLKLDMSQALFASILGVTKKAVESWESGTKAPSGPVLRMFEILDGEAKVFERIGILTRRKQSA
jgi:putative transcriptional regulator